MGYPQPVVFVKHSERRGTSAGLKQKHTSARTACVAAHAVGMIVWELGQLECTVMSMGTLASVGTSLLLPDAMCRSSLVSIHQQGAPPPWHAAYDARRSLERLVGMVPWESCIRGLRHCCALQAPSVSMAVPRCAMCHGDAVPWHVNPRNMLDVISIMA